MGRSLVPCNSMESVDSQKTLVLGADLANGDQLAGLLPDSPSGYQARAQALVAKPPPVPGPTGCR